MGQWVCTRLASRIHQASKISSNIYFLDNRFYPLAMSQKVCDPWRKQSEAKLSRLCVRRWSKLGTSLALAKKNWPLNSGITNRSWPVLKAESVALTSLSLSFCPAPLDVTLSRFWRSLKSPRSLTTGFESIKILGRNALGVPKMSDLPKQEQLALSTNCATTCRQALRSMMPHLQAKVQEVSKW